MKWIKILLIWLCIIPIAIINGGFRDYVLIQYLTPSIALATSGIILSISILVISEIFLPRIKNFSKKDSIITGLLWMMLTISFEFYFGLSSGSSWRELLQAYNPIDGNLWILVIFTTLFSPIFVQTKKTNFTKYSK